MSKKSERYELRLTKQERKALDKLTDESGYRYPSEWLADVIQKAARRKQLWR